MHRPFKGLPYHYFEVCAYSIIIQAIRAQTGGAKSSHSGRAHPKYPSSALLDCIGSPSLGSHGLCDIRTMNLPLPFKSLSYQEYYLVETQQALIRGSWGGVGIAYWRLWESGRRQISVGQWISLIQQLVSGGLGKRGTDWGLSTLALLGAPRLLGGPGLL